MGCSHTTHLRPAPGPPQVRLGASNGKSPLVIFSRILSRIALSTSGMMLGTSIAKDRFRAYSRRLAVVISTARMPTKQVEPLCGS